MNMSIMAAFRTKFPTAPGSEARLFITVSTKPVSVEAKSPPVGIMLAAKPGNALVNLSPRFLNSVVRVVGSTREEKSQA